MLLRQSPVYRLSYAPLWSARRTMLDVVTEVLGACKTSIPTSAHIIVHSSSTSGHANAAEGNSSSPLHPSYVIHSLWNQRDLVRMEKRTTQKTLLLSTNNEKVSSLHLGIGSDVTDEKVVSYSLDGSVKAVFTKFRPKKAEEEKEVIEVFSVAGKVATNDLAASKRHGKLYTDAEFGSFQLSPSADSTHILYVAEKHRPKSESFFSVMANKFPEDPAMSDTNIGAEYVYRDDWGEQLQKKHQPVLCVLDWTDNHVSVLDNIPANISPGQPVWTPDGNGIVFVGYDHLPERLGLVYCPIRKSRLYHLVVGESKMALPLTFEDKSARCPRFSPDGRTLVYIETKIGGPHFRAMRLMKIIWNEQHASNPEVVIPVPKDTPVKPDEFPGFYNNSLPKRCWASDNKRVVCSTAWRSSHQILVVNAETKQITPITQSLMPSLPKWDLLDVHGDIIVAAASSPNILPRLYAARLPPDGRESELQWVLVDEGAGADKNLEKEAALTEWGVEVIKDKKSGLDFEAIWLKPSTKNKPSGVILWPHGGPHSVIPAGFDIFANALVRLDYAVIFVNYRGSIGFGEKNLRSLLGKVGENDVEDCFRALDVMLGKWKASMDETDILIQGGSHGGFLAAHLIGQFPHVFKACALRNPVINIASKFGTTDIPDWAYVESGIPYPYDSPPTVPPYMEFLKRSPIIHVDKVTTPTLILLGEKDRRVPPGQGMEFYRALKLRNIPTKVLRYPECDHPIAEVDCEADSFVQMVHWFRQYSTVKTEV